MEVTAEYLRERYNAMDTEELGDLYHAGELSDLATDVLEEIVTSRGLDWAQFAKHNEQTKETIPSPGLDWAQLTKHDEQTEEVIGVSVHCVQKVPLSNVQYFNDL